MMLATLAQATVIERSSPMLGGVELVVRYPSAARITPGQFFQLSVEAPHTLLRRPYSVSWADADSERIGFLFSLVGAGSAWLASRSANQTLDVLGPLGRGFEMPDGSRPAICVAGGLGIAVFVGLVGQLRRAHRQVTVLYGARTAGRLLPARRMEGAELRLATDDGSAGHAGPVTELVAGALREEAALFVCGPTPMLRSVVEVCRRLDFPLKAVQVALETPMGCGMGTCLGCAVPAAGRGYLLSCRHGPCVTADLLDWEKVEDAFHA